MNVKLARIKKRLSQKEFAKIVGTSNVTIVKIEKGDIDGVSFGLLKRIAVALDFTFEELFYCHKWQRLFSKSFIPILGIDLTDTYTFLFFFT